MKTHGLSHTPEYRAWYQMKRRCYSQTDISYPRYGGRGIAVCARWREAFLAFLADIGKCPGPGLSLERIDNDGDYEPGNVRWATWGEQCNNRRNNRRIEWRGRVRTLSAWARAVGINHRTIAQRLDAGWDVERALTEPPLAKHRRK